MDLWTLVVMTAAGSAVLAAPQDQEHTRKTYEGYQALLVTSKSANEMEHLRAQIMQNISEVVELNSGRVEATYLASPSATTRFQSLLRALGVEFRVEHQDFAQVLASEKQQALRSGFSWSAYYDIDAINNYLMDRSMDFPQVAKLVRGGYSSQGRSITGLRINTPADNGTKPAILIESGIHAREWITPAASTYLIEQLLTSEDQAVQDMRDRFDWHIFPSVNPDGYHYTHRYDRMWRKTRSKSANGCHGVDPNRNWDHNWGKHSATKDPCDYSLYAGTKPFSEVETRTFSRYVAALEDLRVYVALHADAQMLLVPYSDSLEHCDNYVDLVRIGKTSLKYGEKVNGAKYKGPATAAEILYKASGGSMDWVREALGTHLVFTYELRGRYFHWPAARIPEQGEELLQMLRGLLQEATDLGYF